AGELGCAPREELANTARVSCTYPCEDDDECGQGSICGQNPLDRSMRACARECLNDSECVEGEYCRLLQDVEKQRVVQVCEVPPGGTKQPGEQCSFVNECVHQICFPDGASGKAYCRQICASAGDCSDESPRCVTAGAETDWGETVE